MKKLLAVQFFVALAISAFAQTYTQTTLISSLSNPVAFDVAPDGRYFITQKGGVSNMAVDAQIKVFNPNGTYIGVFYDLSDSCNSDFERGLLGITVHPDFATNQYVYAYYNHRYNGDERIRIVRFTEVNNVGTNPTIIFDLDVADNIAGNHVGGNVHFRPGDPGKIYLTIGDLAYQQGNPTLNYANKLTSPYGKILRINEDGTCPTDNPFYEDGLPLNDTCDWIWSYGHRNSFDFCFSPVTDSMYCTENGWNAWDEVNMIHKGAFYGWANCEGFYANSSTSTLCNLPNDILPIEDWGTPLPAVTGVLFYSSQVMPEFDNHLLVADNDYGRVYDITLGNAPAYDQFVSRTQWMDMTTTGGLTTIKQGADGCVYALKGGYTSNGQLYRVCPQGLNVEEQPSGIAMLSAYPNPANTTTTVQWSLTKETAVTMQILDITGRVVGTVFAKTEEAGSYTTAIDVQQWNLSPGQYFIQLHTTTGVQTTKLLVH